MVKVSWVQTVVRQVIFSLVLNPSPPMGSGFARGENRRTKNAWRGFPVQGTINADLELSRGAQKCKEFDSLTAA